MARGVVVVTALVGVVVSCLGVPRGPQYALLASAYLGQAVPLLTRPVRDHVRGGA